MNQSGETSCWLITGGCGFIGSNFIRYLLGAREGLRVVNLDKLTYAGSEENLKDIENSDRYTFVRGDILDRELLSGLFEQYAFEGVVHFAAESHVDNSILGPDAFVKTNIEGTFALLEAARGAWKPGSNTKRSDVSPRFLHISTDEVFGSLETEGYFDENSRYAPNSPYSASKAASDLLVRSYIKTYGLNAVITNCSNNFGPFQNDEKLIPTIIRTALSGADIPIYGTGANVRDWLYVRDHCEALLLAMEDAPAGTQYVIGGGNERSNLDLARQICSLLDRNRPGKDGGMYSDQLRLVEDRPGHDFRYAVDSSKIEKELGWSPATPFDEGLANTVNWYSERYKPE